MSEENAKNRDPFVDIMRGIAMMLVVLGHTMTGCTKGAENSFLYNIVWSLQIPFLFWLAVMLIDIAGEFIVCQDCGSI